MNARQFRKELAALGATFEPGKGGHLKVFLNGRRSVLPMHSGELPGTHLKNVASAGSWRAAGAQEPEHTNWYVRIPSTAGAPNGKRSSF